MTITKKSIALISLVLAVVISATCLLSSCNQEYDGESDYGVYIKRVEYDSYEDETIYMRVYLALTNDDDKKLDGVSATWHYRKQKDGAAKFKYVYDLSIAAESIFSVAVNGLTQEQLNRDGLEYNTFEVYFEYATIYKSLKGDVKHVKTASGYAFDFPIEDTQDSFQTTFVISTQNSAVWYGILIAFATVAFVVVLAVVLTRRKKYAERHE